MEPSWEAPDLTWPIRLSCKGSRAPLFCSVARAAILLQPASVIRARIFPAFHFLEFPDSQIPRCPYFPDFWFPHSWESISKKHFPKDVWGCLRSLGGVPIFWHHFVIIAPSLQREPFVTAQKNLGIIEIEHSWHSWFSTSPTSTPRNEALFGQICVQTFFLVWSL
jgi:hypothetical protein